MIERTTWVDDQARDHLTSLIFVHLATSPEDAAKDTAGKAAERGIAARRYIIARDNGIFDDSWEVMWKLRFGGSL